MRSSFLPFTRPSITAAEIDEVCAALRSGWITSGPRVESFEKAFAEHAGARYALAVTSATAGFHILLQALGVRGGDEVATVSLTWPSAVNMIELAGARPVFVDVDQGTLQMDPRRLEAAITPRTKVAIPVHFAGQPFDLDRIQKICAARGVILIEDAAHAVGTEYRGRRIGSHGNVAVFSFHAIKNLTTGEGGMITLNDEELYNRLRLLRFHGVDKDAWKRYAAASKTAGAGSGYDLLEPGWKYNLTDLQAALGLAQLRRIGELNERRARLADLYDRELARIPEILRPARVSYPARHAWHLYTVLIDRERTGYSRDRFREELGKRHIGTGLHFLAVHQLDYYRRRYPQLAGTLPESESIGARILSLPLFPDMEERDVQDAIEAIQDVLRQGR